MDEPQDAMAGAELVGSVRFWMRAYPRRWRTTRGQELLDLVVDLAGPDVRRLGGRAALDLLRGGWATRWREHPPLRIWLPYRLFDRRIPVAYRSWALDDIDGPWYLQRQNLPGLLVVPLLPVLVRPWPGEMGPFFGVFFAVLVVGPMSTTTGRKRREARLRHVMPLAGEPLVAGTILAWDVPRERASSGSALTWAVFLSGIAVAATVGASLRGGWALTVPILLVALGFGVLGAALAWRRLGRLLRDRPGQPDRVLRPVSAADRTRLLFWALLMVSFAWWEVSLPNSLGLVVVLGAVALVLLPGAAVALAMVRRHDLRDLAGRDVWWIATRGRPPVVDRPVPALRPQPGPVPDGAVVQPRLPADPSYPQYPAIP